MLDERKQIRQLAIGGNELFLSLHSSLLTLFADFDVSKKVTKSTHAKTVIGVRFCFGVFVCSSFRSKTPYIMAPEVFLKNAGGYTYKADSMQTSTNFSPVLSNVSIQFTLSAW